MTKRKKKLVVTAQRAVQPLGEFLIASIKPKDLVEISFVDVRRIEERDVEKYLGIQRPLVKSRVNDIKEYIQGADATFPTSIILAVDSRCAEFDDKSKQLTLYPFEPEEGSDEEPIEYGKIAKILDGQHRIAAYLDDNDEFYFDPNIDFDLNVSIFIGIDISEQANIFATVNLAQTKVNKSLVYDLEDLSKTRSPHKTCHLVAVALDRDKDSSLYKRIKRLGVATPGRDYEPLTQAVVVESLVKFMSKDPFEDRRLLLKGKKLSKVNGEILVKYPFRNLFIDGDDKQIYKILINYFKAVANRWPKAWVDLKPQGNLLPKSNAFRALMKYLKDYVYLSLVSEEDIGDLPTEDQFLIRLKKVDIDDKDFTTRNFAPGSGGQSKFYKLLTGKIKKEDLFE